MNDQEYVYYAYKVDVFNDDDIDYLMRNGIYTIFGNNLNAIALPIENNVDAEEYIESLIDDKFTNIAVLRFPKDLFKPEVFYGQLKELPIPIWKDEIHLYDVVCTRLDSNYIYRLYNKKNGDLDYINNENYSPINDPVGKQFDVAQLNSFLEVGADSLYDFGIARRKKEYDELCLEDIATRVWDYTEMYLKEKYRNKAAMRLVRRK